MPNSAVMPEGSIETSGGPSEVPLKELKIRVRFAAICRGAQVRIGNGEIPFWLKQMDADIERARRAASLTVNAHLPLQELILGLDMAYSEAPPAPGRTLRKELKQLVEAVERLSSKLDGVSSELQVEMLGAPAERCVDEETTTFEWPRDPLRELKGALDHFTEETRAPAIPEGTAGPRQAFTTIATDALVDIALESQADCDRATLARLAEDLLSPVLARHQGPSSDRQPDWHDRVGAALRRRSIIG